MESNSGVLLECDWERVKRSCAYKPSRFEISTPPRNAALFDSTSFQLMTVPTLTADISSLEARYVDSCKRHKLPSNAAVLLWLSKAMLQESGHGQCKLVVLLHQLKDADFLPLVDMIEAIGSSAIDAVDILQEPLSVVNEGYLMTLMRKINQKLHTVDLRDLSLTKDFLWDLFQGGLSCKVLKLNSSDIYKLDMAGRFAQLRTLNMDFCTHLTSLQKDCFSFMPNLRHLSMCETRVANLWTTSAALSRLPSLVELRFQNCLCCEDTGPCPTLLTDKISSGWLKKSFNSEAVYANRGSITHANEDQFDDNLDEISSHLQNISLLGLSSNLHCSLKNKTSHGDSWIQDGNDRPNLNDANTLPKNYISHHPSPICFEKHYREFMVASLPRLEVLDNMPIRRMDRQIAKTIFSRYFEYLPYRKQHKESVVSVLHRREMGSGSIYRPLTSKLRKNQNYFSRSFCAAKLGSSTWPLLCPISKLSCTSKEGNKSPRPRQFEYHPSDPSLMAFGTLDGEVVILNHENRKIVAYMPSFGAMNCVLGLSWLRKYPSKVLAGSDSGFLKLFDINQKVKKAADAPCGMNHVMFDKFEQLTSVHTNSTDEQFLVSGYSTNVALYDIGSRKRLQLFTDMHKEPINVAKFAHHSPFMFATSSFDHDVKMWDLRERMIRPCYTATSSRGNVMVCFSPDDLYLLVSAIDNEVKQLLAVDGRLHTDFEITSSGSSHNYTRSYYMNGRDYIISGSSDEHVVHVCCAQTGRRLRDVYVEDGGSGKAVFVQSLRSDPFRPFNMSILAASTKSSSKCEVIKVDLLSSNQYGEDYFHFREHRHSSSLGGKWLTV